MQTAFVMTWREYERGMGNRPDGISLHVSPEEFSRYIAAYNESLPDDVPDEYSQADGWSETLTRVVIEDEELITELREKGSLRFWQFELPTLETTPVGTVLLKPHVKAGS